jgi:hypothetical protein
VIVLCRCQVCRVLVGDGVAFGTQRVERVAEVGSGPEHGGVGDQCETERLIDLVVQVTPAEVRRTVPQVLGSPQILVGISPKARNGISSDIAGRGGTARGADVDLPG